jgi:acetylornithine deacetylase/succinyl-diaminopimelate desuccinylase-like protein
LPSPTDWVAANKAAATDELFEFLRIPSVSARSEHRADVARAADWLAARLREAGLAAEVIPTAGHPVVLGEWREAGPDAPTYLVYGHYDVQPAEPLELWTSPPFDPTVRDGRIYARGSVDDKGQLYLHVKALQAHLASSGRLPVNVIVLAEGEEEVGSEHLSAFVEEHARRLACDGVIISDSAMFGPGLPSILFSLRGLAYLQVDVTGPATDLHSGSYGGAIVNPAAALARIIASFHDDQRRVAIPGFYDRVVEWQPAVREQISALPFREEGFREEAGAPALGGESGYSTLERIWTRPTLEVNGLLSGYTGQGAKTVLPSRAMAKISCRLVPDQSPDEIAALVTAHVRRMALARQSVGPAFRGGAPRPRACLRRGAGAGGGGRFDPRGGRLPAHPGRSRPAHGLRASRGKRSRAGRVDERGELRDGDARRRPALGGAGHQALGAGPGAAPR